METSLQVILIATLSLSLVWVVLRIGTFFQRKVRWLHDPVYVPSSPQALQAILDFTTQYVPLTKKTRAIDVGSGDGRVVIALAKLGIKAEGVEINPYLVWKSRQAIEEARVSSLATIHSGSFWNINYSKYNLVVLYATASIMDELTQKLEAELKPGTVIISHHFPFLKWKPLKTKNDVFIYRLEK